MRLTRPSLLVCFAAFCVAIAAGVVGCGGSDEAAAPAPVAEPSPAPEPAPAEETEPYVIRLRVTPDSNRVRARGTTNLPDGALITVLASRAFRYANETDVHAVSAARDAVIVADGEFATTLDLNEDDLLVGLEFQGDPGFGPIEVVDTAVTVCAQFRTGDEDGEPIQEGHVVEAVGPNGERLEGSPQVTVFGALTDNPSNWLEAERRARVQSPLLAEIADIQGERPRSRRLTGFCL